MIHSSVNRPALIALMSALLLAAPLAHASKPKAKKEAAPVALADLSEEQLANAERVFTGLSACEFNQSVDVEPHAAKKGYFDVAFKGKKYVLAPEPTTTGAVRLEDKKNGIVWIQIANKSMLMNAKVGQRLIDNCVHPNQKI